MTAPASNARSASSAVASECPHATTTPRALRSVDQLERAFELRSERHVRHRPGREEPLEQSAIRVAARGCGMGAEALRRQERPFEVGADHARPDRDIGDSAERRRQLVLRSGDERRLEGGHAGRGESLAGAGVAGCVGSREVDAIEAVHLQVDEARDRDAAAAARQPHGGDASVGDLKVACDERAVDHGCLDTESHPAKGRTSLDRVTRMGDARYPKRGGVPTPFWRS